MSSIAFQLESIVGADAVYAWETLDPMLSQQITQAVTPASVVDCVVCPSTQAALAEVIACAHRDRWRMLLCGSGSKLHWGGLADGIQLVISTAHCDRLVAHAVGDLTVTAEAGMKLSDLQAQLATAGQFLPIDPAYGATATLGGIVATADTGAWRQRYGGIRDLLIGLSIVRSDGQMAKAGGRVVKNVAGYDLMKLFTGSYGTLGAIGQVSFRVYPLPPASQTVVLTGAVEAIAQATTALLASGLSPVAIELITPDLAADLAIGQGLGMMVRFQSMAVSVDQQTDQLLQLGEAIGLPGQCITGADELRLWQQLRDRIERPGNESQITCKIGVLPANAVELLHQLSYLDPALKTRLKTGVIHAASGLGLLQFDSLSTLLLTQLRDRCEAEGGFLTVLQAPLDVKQTIDVWGYSGNALAVMRSLKQQFDPDNLFSPRRFVGGL